MYKINLYMYSTCEQEGNGVLLLRRHIIKNFFTKVYNEQIEDAIKSTLCYQYNRARID